MAWIADRLDPNNPDFIRDGKSIFKDYVDFSGNGPDTQTGGEEAFGHASMIAAQGNETYDLSDYNSPAYPLPKNRDIKIEGVAPGCVADRAEGRRRVPGQLGDPAVHRLRHRQWRQRDQRIVRRERLLRQQRPRHDPAFQ